MLLSGNGQTKKKFASGQQYGTSQTIISTKYTFAGLEKS
jgi:hypothetical protein